PLAPFIARAEGGNRRLPGSQDRLAIGGRHVHGRGGGDRGRGQRVLGLDETGVRPQVVVEVGPDDFRAGRVVVGGGLGQVGKAGRNRHGGLKTKTPHKGGVWGYASGRED